VSLSAPLSGHGLTGTGQLALICMHLAVGAVLIPVFALSTPRWRSADDDPAKAGAGPKCPSPALGDTQAPPT
jgi:hypothetical protein